MFSSCTWRALNENTLSNKKNIIFRSLFLHIMRKSFDPTCFRPADPRKRFEVPEWKIYGATLDTTRVVSVSECAMLVIESNITGL